MDRKTYTVFAVIALVLGSFGWMAADQTTGASFVRNGMPPQVTSLPENGKLGDVVFLMNSSAGNPVGLYACNLTSCGTLAGGWVCTSCGGGGFTAANDLSGTPSSQTVIGVQNKAFQSGAPTSGDFWRYNGTVWNHTGIVAGDIPNLDAAKITTGIFADTMIPATINHATVFGGSVTGTNLISNGGGESNFEAFDNAGACGIPVSSGAYHICSQSGLVGIVPFGGAFSGIELRSRSGVANGYAPLNASTIVPASYLGTGSAVDSNCLHGSNTWQPCSSGAGSSFATISFSATPTFDLSTAATFKITLTGNVTSSTLSSMPSSPLTTQVVMIVCQDATGGRTFVPPANMRGFMVVGTIPSTCSAQQFATDGTLAYATESGVVNQ